MKNFYIEIKLKVNIEIFIRGNLRSYLTSLIFLYKYLILNFKNN